MATKKGNFLTKKVPFGGKEMTLYSLDGVTWSTRPDELQSIIERHSSEQKGFSDDLQGKEKDKTAQPEKPKAKRFQKVHNDDELDEVIEDDLYPEDDYEEYEAEVGDGEDSEDVDDGKSKKQKGAKSKAESPKKQEAKLKTEKVSKSAAKPTKATKPAASKKPAPKKAPLPTKKVSVPPKKEKPKTKKKK